MQEDLDLFRENVRRFIEQEVAPHYEQWERAEIVPRGIWNQVGEQGLLCVDVPEAYGGIGADFLFSVVIMEEFARANYGGIGGPIAKLQTTRFKLAEVATDIRINRAFVNECVELFRKGSWTRQLPAWPSCPPPRCRAGWWTPACSCTAATATCGSTACPAPMSTPGCNASTVAPARS